MEEGAERENSPSPGEDMVRKKAVGVGLLGCGHIGRVAHLANYAKNPLARLVAVMDVNPEAARATATEFAVPRWYTDVDAFLADPEVEAVSIATFHTSHGELAARAASAGKHVLVEKPMASHYADAAKALAAAREAGVWLTVGYQPRFQFQWRKVKELLDLGVEGRPHEVVSVNGSWHTVDLAHAWFHDKEKAGGGVLLDHASYTVYSFIYWLGRVSAVSAHTATWVPEKEAHGNSDARIPVTVEDVAGLLLKFEQGTTGLLYTSWASPVGHHYLEIVGDRGRIGMGKDPEGRAAIEVFTSRDDLAPAIPHGFSTITVPQEDYRDAHYAKIDDFLRAIVEKRPPTVSAEDAAHAIEVLDAAYRSSETGQTIHLPLA